MSDAAYFSAFFELPFEAHTRHLRSIDQKRKNVKGREREKRAREGKRRKRN